MNKPGVVVAALCASIGIAHADPAADDFKRGKAAMKAGKIHDACLAFEASDKAVAKVETELALADCYEQDGRPVTAAKLYRSLAEKDPNMARRKTSSERVIKLEAKAAKLRIVPNQRPDGLVIMVDGAVVPNTGDVLVDAGPHEVTATAPNMAGHASAPVDRDKQIVDVILRLEAVAVAVPVVVPVKEPPPVVVEPKPSMPNPQPEPVMMPPPHDVEDHQADHRKRNGVILAGVGVGVVVVSAVLFASSSSKFDDEHALCPSSKCATQADLTKAHSLLDDGHLYRGLSLGLGIGGIALVGVGAYLLLTPHKEESHLAFSLDHHGGGLTYSARF